MTRGFTPFCFQKMDKGSEIALHQLEECMECTTYTLVMDLTKCNQSLKFSPIMEPLAFLTTAIANTHALAWALLFTNTSPLTQGLQDLQLATPHAATSAQSQTHLCCNVKTTMTQATNTVHTKMTQPTPKPPDLNPIQSKYPSIPSVHMLPDPSIQHHPTFETLMSWTVGQHGPKNTLKLPFNVAPMHQQTTQRQQQASKWKPTKRLPEAM